MSSEWCTCYNTEPQEESCGCVDSDAKECVCPPPSKGKEKLASIEEVTKRQEIDERIYGRVFGVSGPGKL